MAKVAGALVFIAIAFAFFTAWLADAKGRSSGVWAVLGFLFGPIAFLAVGLAPEVKPEASTEHWGTKVPKREEGPIAPDAKPWDPNAGPPTG